MGAGRQRGGDGGDVEHAGAGLAVEAELERGPGIVPQCLQGLDEGGILACACRVEELPRPAQRLQAADHAEDRRDADAAGNEDARRGRFLEREVIARRTDGQGVARAQHFVQIARAAATLRVLVDADQVAMPFLRRVEQGIVADQAVGQMHVDVRPGFERREFLVRGYRPEFVAEDAFRFPGNGFDPDLQCLGNAHGCLPGLGLRGFVADGFG